MPHTHTLLITDLINLKFYTERKSIPIHILQVMLEKNVSHNSLTLNKGYIIISGVSLHDINFWITLING